MSILDEFYPGSKQRRQEPVVVDEAPPQPWDANPIVRTIRGKEMSFYGIGALAQALGRSIVGVRLWERQGLIPKAPYRMPDHKGGKGKRLYTRAVIEATVAEFARMGLMEPGARVRWEGEHQDLTARLVERWTEVVENEKHS